jgi:signal transduction histidine kinase
MQSKAATGACLVVGAAWGLLPRPAWAAETAIDPTFAASLIVAALAVVLAILHFSERTRRRRAEQALAEQAARQARLAGLLEAAPSKLWSVAADGSSFGSAGIGRWLGLAAEPRQVEDFTAAFAAADFARLRDALAGADGTSLDLAARDGRIIQAEVCRIADGGRAVWLGDATASRRSATEIRDAAALAAEEMRRFSELLAGTAMPLWRRDASLNLVWCNRTYAEMVEATPPRVVADGIELASAAQIVQATKLAQRAHDLGAAQREVRHVVVAGDRRALRVVEAPLPNGDLVGWAEDVTELESVQGDLASHIDAHAEVLQNLATAIGIFGPDKRLLLFNRAFARLWRLDEAWLAQQPTFAELLEQLREHRRLPEQADWQAYKRSQVALFTAVIEPREELMHLPDERTLRVVITPHPFGGLLFTYEDVTDQLVLERARNTLIAVQRATLDNLYEGVAVYGGDGRLRLWNAAFVNIWQIGAEMLANEPHINDIVETFRALVDEGGDWQATKRRMIEPFSDRNAQSGRIERPDGSVVDYASVPLPDGAVLFTYLDVTDSIRIERALRDRNEALQAADQLKSEFIANVSYELRTPLNTIIGFAEIIANQYFGQLNQRQLEYAEGILDSSHQLLFLVNDILDLATIEAGHMVLERESFDLHATFVAILGLTRERARRQNLTIDLGCPPDVGWIDADERRIKQVLFNLMSNAMKFTPPGGTIALGARRSDTEVVLWVTDTGIGIPESEQQRIFQRFYKSRAGSRHPGAGLGLSLVRSFIELHGGRVELRSVPEQGTSVTCILPLTPVQQVVPVERQISAVSVH